MTQDWGPKVFSVDDAAPEAIAKQLRPFTYPVGQEVPWAVTRDRLGERGGEVRRSEDWRKLPKDESVLIVAGLIEDEYVIRWGATSGLYAVLDAGIHDCFLGPGDDWSDLRKGWAQLTQDGRVQVTS
jgi:hypothetical protein